MVKIRNLRIRNLVPEQGIAAVIDKRVTGAWAGGTSNDATIPYSTVFIVCIQDNELVKARPGDGVAGKDEELLDGLLSSADIYVTQNKLQLTTVDLSKCQTCEKLDESEVVQFLKSETPHKNSVKPSRTWRKA